jgi:hypothetical protein
VITQNKELASFDEVLEVSYGEIDGQKLAIKRAVPCFWGVLLPREESDGAPFAVDVLLQNCPNGIL